jgi:hypothetical protein
VAFFYGKIMAVDPTIDPQKIAETNTITQSMDAAGPPEEFAEDPMLLAGAGFKPFLKLLLKEPPVAKPNKDITPIESDQLTAGGVMSGQPSKVPTSQEYNIIDNVGNFDYNQTQKEVATKLRDKGILSQEGFDQFEARNFRAFPSDEENITAKALDILDEGTFDAEAKEIIQTGQKGVTADKQGFTTEMGTAGANKTAQLLSYIKNDVKNLDDFNFDRIDSPEDLKNTIGAVSELMKNETSKFTRGVVTNDETRNAAINKLKDEINLTRSILKRKLGEPLGAEQLLAGRQLLVSSAKKLTEMAKLIDSGKANDIDKLNFRRQLAIHSALQAQLKGAQTEVARALQSFNIKVGGEFDAYAAGEASKAVLAEDLRSGVSEELASKLLMARKQAEDGGNASDVLKAVNTFSEGSWYAKTKQQVHQAFMASILSSPGTQFKNLVGNTLFMVGQLPAEFIAGIYGDVLRAAFPNAKFAQSMDNASTMDAVYRATAWMGSIDDALRAAMVAFKTNMPARASKLDLDLSLSQTSAKTGIIGQSADFVSKAFSIPFRFLLAGDEFFKSLSARGELGVQAHRRYNQILRQKRMEKGDLTKEDFQDAFDQGLMVYMDPKSVDAALQEKAAYDTLTSPIGKDNIVGKAIGQFQNTLVGRFIIAFSTAPTNDILNTVDFVPIVSMLRPKTFKNITGQNGPAAHQNAMGKWAFGSGVAFTAYQMVQSGRFIGPAPKDKNQREAFYAAGKQPYSIVTRGEGFPKNETTGEFLPLFDSYGIPNGPLNYTSIAGFGPMASILSIYGHSAEMIAALPKTPEGAELSFKIGLGATLSTLQYYEELPTLQGVANILQSFRSLQQKEEAGTIYRNITDFIGDTVGTSVLENAPFFYSSFIGNLDANVDPVRLKPRKDFKRITEEDLEKFILLDGSKNYHMLGMPTDSFSDAYVDYSNWAKSLIAKRSPLKDKDNLVPTVDGRGEIIGTYQVLNDKGEYETRYETPSFSQNPSAATWNFLTGMKYKQSNELDAVDKEMLRLTMVSGDKNYPLSVRKRLNGMRLSDGEIYDYNRLAKSQNDGVLVKGYTFNEALEGLINNTKIGKKFGAYMYHRSDVTTKDQITIIKQLEDQFYDEAVKELLELPGYENLRQVYEAKERLKAQ